MWDNLEKIEKHYQELELKMTSSEVLLDPRQLSTLAQERSALEVIVRKYRQYKAVTRTLEETRALLNEQLDQEMLALVKQEVESLEQQVENLSHELKIMLLPKDAQDERDVIMEIRAGTGGNEAGLFAADLFRMYSRYAQSKGWDLDTINISEGALGGFKEIIFEIKGKGIFRRLKYERGVHRVQRVPVTEASGRIHTSTATVAVLPKAEEVDLSINPDDLRIDIYHSSGPGGQSVNKVATAVRITHLPSNIVVVCQDERSQFRNKMKALSVLRSRLLDMERYKQEKEMTDLRRSQVGTGERNEKIRTYNVPQDRVTDHRFGLTLRNLPGFMEGGLDELLDNLATKEQTRLLGELAT
jgi:peptide chain release factor 1